MGNPLGTDTPLKTPRCFQMIHGALDLQRNGRDRICGGVEKLILQIK